MFAYRALVAAACIVAVGIGGYFVWRDMEDRRYAECRGAVERYAKRPSETEAEFIGQCIAAKKITKTDFADFEIDYLWPSSPRS